MTSEYRKELYKQAIPVFEGMELTFSDALGEAYEEQKELKKKLSKFKMMKREKDPELLDMNNEVEALEFTLANLIDIIGYLEARIK